MANYATIKTVIEFANDRDLDPLDDDPGNAAQLLLAIITDRTVGRVDQPVFGKQLANFDLHGIKDFFTDTAGDRLGDARRQGSANDFSYLRRQVDNHCPHYQSHRVGRRCRIHASSDTRPALHQIRLIADDLGFVGALTLLILLFVAVALGDLRSVPFSSRTPTVGRAVSDYFSRLKNGRHRARYVTGAFFCNAIVGVTSAGL